MKNKIKLSALLLLAMLVLNSCDSGTNPTTSDEFFEAKINGVQWIGDLNFRSMSPSGLPSMSSVMKVYNGSSLMISLPKKVELFVMPQFMDMSAFRGENGEMILTRATLSIPPEIPSPPNPPMPIALLPIRSFDSMNDPQTVLRITRLDTVNRVMEGEFSFRAREVITRLDSLNQFGSPIITLGDSTITVTDGRFRIKYETGFRWGRD
jgi:hypothetical protein